MGNLKLALAVILYVLALSSKSVAEPQIDSVLTAGGGRFAHGVDLIVHGKNFDSKPNGWPILVDYVSHAYQRGELTRFSDILKDMQAIPIASEAPSSRWAANSTDSAVVFSTTRPKRHAFDAAGYLMRGNNSWLGRPTSYGGISGWNTPVDNPYLYVSWWVKFKYNSTYYWRFSPETINGRFLPGEPLSVGDSIKGTYIGVDGSGLINAVFEGQRNANNLKGLIVKGLESGATTKFPQDFRAGEGIGYETPGSKYLRIWDDPGSNGIRTSLSQFDFFLVAYSDPSLSSGRVYDTVDVEANKWHHFEAVVDASTGEFKSWFNGRLRGVAKFDPAAMHQGLYSPTIALLGNNGKQEVLQEMDVSEIYMDSSLQRVVLSNASEFDSLNNYELQVPMSWSDGEITFKANLGSLDISKPLYLYVYDQNGIANSTGVPICREVDCVAPPAPVDLTVE